MRGDEARKKIQGKNMQNLIHDLDLNLKNIEKTANIYFFVMFVWNIIK